MDAKSRPLRNLETMRRTVWNPTLRKKREEWGTSGVVELKSGWVATRTARLVVTQIRASYVSQGCAHKNIRRKMFLRRIARETYTCGERVSAPFKPLLVRITVRDNRGESKTCGRMSRGKRPS